MPGGGGVGRGSVKVHLEETGNDKDASSSTTPGKANASVGKLGGGPKTFVFTFPSGAVWDQAKRTVDVTLNGPEEVTFVWTP